MLVVTQVRTILLLGKKDKGSIKITNESSLQSKAMKKREGQMGVDYALILLPMISLVYVRLLLIPKLCDSGLGCGSLHGVRNIDDENVINDDF